jgi:RES domain-containing protein
LIPAWRICRLPFADLHGEGARRYGGRWNSPGRALVYLAEHPALAALEVRVHLDLPHDLLPDDYALVEVALPDEPPEEVAALPADTVAEGDSWIESARSAVLRVPSALLPRAWNLLLNPRHPRASDARIIATEPFRFDPRLGAAAQGTGTAPSSDRGKRAVGERPGAVLRLPA